MGNIVMLIVAALLIWRFQQGFWRGLTWAVGMLVSLPKQIQITLPGDLPAVTVQRLIVLILLGYWLKERHNWVKDEKQPFKTLLKWILVTQAVSAIFSPDQISSLKAFLYCALENLLYFVMVVTIVRNLNDAFRLVRAMCLGLLGVAILAFIERYRGYSPMQYFPGYYADPDTVMATFSHRILLGAAMAMGLPLCMFWITRAQGAAERALGWLTALLCIGACFFAHSRGPWMATAMAIGIFGVLGSGVQRKRLAVIAVLAMIVWVSNSGIRDTVLQRFGGTFQDDSASQLSYQWRWELWHKAWMEITRSPIRTVLGYGPGTSETLNWEGQVSIADLVDSFSSWDNHWAAYMLECGVLGFGVLLVLYAAVMRRMWNVWQLARGPARDFPAFVMAGLVVFLFMQNNVKIFAPQLDYLFWTILAVGIAIQRDPAWSGEPRKVEAPVEPPLEGVWPAANPLA